MLVSQRLRIILSFLFAATVFGCDAGAPPAAPSTAPVPAVASLSPAASDLLIGMGCEKHLIAVSNWDVDRPGTQGLPRVGDYNTIDFERLLQLRPQLLIVQYRADKMPMGLTERCEKAGISLVNVKINTLEDVFSTINQLGKALNNPAAAAAMTQRVQTQLKSVRLNVKNKPRVRTLIIRDDSGFAAVGGGNFIDDLLRIAGGENVLGSGDNSYPTLDREKLIALDAEVILHFLPSPSPQVREQVKRQWEAMDNLRAVKNKRVYILDDYYLLQPSHRIGDTAERMAECLHGSSTADAL